MFTCCPESWCHYLIYKYGVLTHVYKGHFLLLLHTKIALLTFILTPFYLLRSSLDKSTSEQSSQSPLNSSPLVL